MELPYSQATKVMILFFISHVSMGNCWLCFSKPKAGVGRVQTTGKWGLASSIPLSRSKGGERSSFQRQRRGLEKRREPESLSKSKGDCGYTQEEVSSSLSAQTHHA